MDSGELLVYNLMYQCINLKTRHRLIKPFRYGGFYCIFKRVTRLYLSSESLQVYHYYCSNCSFVLRSEFRSSVLLILSPA